MGTSVVHEWNNCWVIIRLTDWLIDWLIDHSIRISQLFFVSFFADASTWYVRPVDGPVERPESRTPFAFQLWRHRGALLLKMHPNPRMSWRLLRITSVHWVSSTNLLFSLKARINPSDMWRHRVIRHPFSGINTNLFLWRKNALPQVLNQSINQSMKWTLTESITHLIIQSINQSIDSGN